MTDELRGLLRDQVADVVPGRDLAGLALAGARWERRRERLLGGAAVAVLLCGALAAVVTGSGPGDGAGDALVAAAGQPAFDANASLLVREGDRVTGAGRIVQVAGGQPELCGTEVFASVGYAPGAEPPPGPCRYGVRLDGVDMARLDRPREKAGAMEGFGTVTGTYRYGVVTVESQEPRSSTGARTGVDFSTPPCETPAGGWTPGPDHLDLGPYTDVVATRPDLAVGGPAQASPGSAVLVVLARDDAARAELDEALRPAYGTNVCVIVSRFSAAEVTAAQREVAQAMTALRSSSSGGARTPDWQLTASAQTLLVDQAALDLAGRHPAGLVRYEPTLRPVR